jgi:hypothetical protein
MTYTAIEETSAQYTTVLEDAAHVPLPFADINAVTLTLIDVETRTVINGRDAQDVKNNHEVTIDPTSGTLTWAIQPADNVIVTDGEEIEIHHAIFEVTYRGSQKLVHDLYLLVQNVEEVV